MNLSVTPSQNALSRFRNGSAFIVFHAADQAATRPPRQPTAIPPTTSSMHSSTGRKWIDDRFIADASGAR